MREKIISLLKAKSSGVNLSKARMDAIADRLAPKITDEAEIDSKLDELNEIMPFADIAKQDDKIRDLESKVKKPKDEPKLTTDPINPPTEADDIKTQLEELKQIREQFKTELNQIKTSKIKEDFIAKAVKEGVPLWLAKKVSVTDDFDSEASIKELKDEYAEIKQYEANADTGSGQVPRGTGTQKKQASKEEVDKILDKIM